MKKRLCLIGAPGVGKTSIARALRNKFSYLYIDLDEEIERKERRTVSDIILRDGESYFREKEYSVLAEVMKRDFDVLSLGGGSLKLEKSKTLVFETAFVIWLKASVESITNRLVKDPEHYLQRPLLFSGRSLAGSLSGDDALTRKELEKKLSLILQEREKVYMMAHVHIETECRKIEEIAEEISKVDSSGNF